MTYEYLDGILEQAAGLHVDYLVVDCTELQDNSWNLPPPEKHIQVALSNRHLHLLCNSPGA